MNKIMFTLGKDTTRVYAVFLIYIRYIKDVSTTNTAQMEAQMNAEIYRRNIPSSLFNHI